MNTTLVTDLILTYIDLARYEARRTRHAVNSSLKQFGALELIVGTFGVTILLQCLWRFIFQRESLYSRTMKTFFKMVKKLPAVKKRITKEMQKTVRVVEEEFGVFDSPYIGKLPQRGWSKGEILDETRAYLKRAHYDPNTGSLSGTVYNNDTELTSLMTEVYGLAAWTNPLHPDVFPGVRKMEAEVVQMGVSLFHGSPQACGTMTSGGTESILMACKAYRDYALETKGIRHPEIVAAITVHAAFDKAAEYFGMRMVHVPVDPKTMSVDLKAMRRAIGRNTCMLVASTPAYPHGVLDNVVEVAKMGLKYNVPVHVDACLGGFLLPFMEEAGFPLPPFDFRVPGVTSISADTHKYGFAPKGSSVVLYSCQKFRRCQFFFAPNWPGGIYASPTMGGSRAGGIIAACWAALLYFGHEGYVDSTRKIITTQRYMRKGLEKIDGIFVYGEPEVSVIALGSNEFSIYRLSDGLKDKGWNLNALQFPASIHICCTYMHTKPGVADRFIRDVTEVTAEIMKDPKAKAAGAGAVYGMSQSIPDRSLVAEVACIFLDTLYKTKPTIPEDD